MLQIVDRHALLAESSDLKDRLAARSIAVIPLHVVEKHKAAELAAAPKPLWFFGRTRYHIFNFFYQKCLDIFEIPIFIRQRTYTIGRAQWQRSYPVVLSPMYLGAPPEIISTAFAAQEAVPAGRIFIDELVQDTLVIDPVLGIEDEDGQIAYLRIWKGRDIII